MRQAITRESESMERRVFLTPAWLDSAKPKSTRLLLSSSSREHGTRYLSLPRPHPHPPPCPPLLARHSANSGSERVTSSNFRGWSRSSASTTRSGRVSTGDSLRAPVSVRGRVRGLGLGVVIRGSDQRYALGLRGEFLLAALLQFRDRGPRGPGFDG
jgi:hypothetical protein